MNERVRKLTPNSYPDGDPFGGKHSKRRDSLYGLYGPALARVAPALHHRRIPLSAESSSGSFSETIGSLATIRVLGETAGSEVAFFEHSLYIPDNSRPQIFETK